MGGSVVMREEELIKRVTGLISSIMKCDEVIKGKGPNTAIGDEGSRFL